MMSEMQNVHGYLGLGYAHKTSQNNTKQLVLQ